MRRDELLVALLEGAIDERPALAELVSIVAGPIRAQAQTARCVVLSASDVAREAGRTALADELRRLALSRIDRRVFGLHAAELVEDPSGSFRSSSEVRCSCASSEPPLAEDVERYLAEAGPQPTGAGLEGKLRVTRVARDADGVVRCELAPTTWERARGFHLSLLNRPAMLAVRRPTWRWIDAAFAGWPQVPGLAAVHGIVLTSDRWIVLQRRSESVSYKPGHWSATFEEQVVPADLCGDATLARATARGVREELGFEVSESQIHVVATLLELDTLNIAFAAVVETPRSKQELLELWLRRTDRAEGDRVGFVGIESDPPTRVGPQPQHPTTEVRLRLLRRWMQAR